jgi:hypothetical protein
MSRNDCTVRRFETVRASCLTFQASARMIAPASRGFPRTKYHAASARHNAT